MSSDFLRESREKEITSDTFFTNLNETSVEYGLQLYN